MLFRNYAGLHMQENAMYPPPPLSPFVYHTPRGQIGSLTPFKIRILLNKGVFDWDPPPH